MRDQRKAHTDDRILFADPLVSAARRPVMLDLWEQIIERAAWPADPIVIMGDPGAGISAGLSLGTEEQARRKESN